MLIFIFLGLYLAFQAGRDEALDTAGKESDQMQVRGNKHFHHKRNTYMQPLVSF